MTDDKIAEIRARHDAVHNVLRGSSDMHDDRGYLLAEVDRLREALTMAAGYVNGCYHAWHLTRDRAEALRDLTKIRAVLNDERAGEL